MPTLEVENHSIVEVAWHLFWDPLLSVPILYQVIVQLVGRDLLSTAFDQNRSTTIYSWRATLIILLFILFIYLCGYHCWILDSGSFITEFFCECYTLILADSDYLASSSVTTDHISIYVSYI